jgi:import inner membrane translocase subunit TIM44
VSEATEPIRKTEAYKALAETVMDALDDSGSAKHGGYEEKEVRRLRRKMRLERAGRSAGLNARARVAADEKSDYPLLALEHTDILI